MPKHFVCSLAVCCLWISNARSQALGLAGAGQRPPLPSAPGDRDQFKEMRRADDQAVMEMVGNARGVVKDLQKVDKNWLRFTVDQKELTVEKWRVFSNPKFEANARMVRLLIGLRQTDVTNQGKSPPRGLAALGWQSPHDIRPLGKTDHLRGGETVIVIYPKESPDRVWGVIITKADTPAPKVAAASADDATDAARRLKYARQYLHDSKQAIPAEADRLKALAKKHLQEIVDKYADTPAAADAQKLLDGL